MQRAASATLAGVADTPPLAVDSPRSKETRGDAALSAALEQQTTTNQVSSAAASVGSLNNPKIIDHQID